MIPAFTSVARGFTGRSGEIGTQHALPDLPDLPVNIE